MIFSKPSDAVKFALLLQAELRADGGHDPSRALLDRIGIHVGEVVIAEGTDGVKDFYGIQVNRQFPAIHRMAQGLIEVIRSRSASSRAIRLARFLRKQCMTAKLEEKESPRFARRPQNPS